MVLVFSLIHASLNLHVFSVHFLVVTLFSQLYFNLYHIVFTGCVLVYVHSRGTGGTGDLSPKSRAHLCTQICLGFPDH